MVKLIMLSLPLKEFIHSLIKWRKDKAGFLLWEIDALEKQQLDARKHINRCHGALSMVRHYRFESIQCVELRVLDRNVVNPHSAMEVCQPLTLRLTYFPVLS